MNGRKSVLSLEDMTNLISVYDAVRQLKKVFLGRMDEHWEDEVIEIVIGVLADETMKPEEKARKLLGME